MSGTEAKSRAGAHHCHYSGDIVLLSSIWAVAKTVTSWWITRSSDEAQYCQGCFKLLNAARQAHDPAGTDDDDGEELSILSIGSDAEDLTDVSQRDPKYLAAVHQRSRRWRSGSARAASYASYDLTVSLVE